MPRWNGRVVRQRSAKPCTRVRFPFPPQSLHVKTPARLAQRESASLTRKRSLVQSQYRAQKPSGFECGCSAVGSASPCQGEGREFESRHPLSLKRRPTGRRFCVVGVVRRWGSVKTRTAVFLPRSGAKLAVGEGFDGKMPSGEGSRGGCGAKV